MDLLSNDGLEPDYDNDDPLEGLPADFPSRHSRVPAVPSTGYGGISFLARNSAMQIPRVVDDVSSETVADCRRVIGDLLGPDVVSKPD